MAFNVNDNVPMRRFVASSPEKRAAVVSKMSPKTSLTVLMVPYNGGTSKHFLPAYGCEMMLFRSGANI